jgi:hypothetical protein
MEIDGKITRVKELIAKREELDAELSELLGGGGPREKRSPKCSICGEPGHRASMQGRGREQIGAWASQDRRDARSKQRRNRPGTQRHLRMDRKLYGFALHAVG